MVFSKKQNSKNNKKTSQDSTLSKKDKQTTAKVSKEGWLSGVKNFLVGVKGELKKVYWPTRRETMVYTGVVLATVTVIAILIWLLDSLLSHGLRAIVG
ncbi:MAG: preprotein translocase subunit SecE [Desulfotomaculum sp.]|nr:preprotein translocase subunit SecE [Desulfotomaculum sp.]